MKNQMKQKHLNSIDVKNSTLKIEKTSWQFNEIDCTNVLTVNEQGIIEDAENIGLLISYNNPKEIDKKLIKMNVSSFIDLVKEYGNNPDFGLVIPSVSYIFLDYYKNIYSKTDINKSFANVVEYNNLLKEKAPVKTLGAKQKK